MTVTELDAPTSGATAIVAGAEHRPQPVQATVDSLLGTGDHKTLGRFLIVASLAHAAVFAVLAALSNAHLASGGSLLDADQATRFDLNSQLGLVVCGLLPLLLGLALYLVPLQIGAATISFPRAAALSTWGWMLSADLFLIAVLADGSFGGTNEKMARLGNVALGATSLSLLIGMTCVVVSVLSLRAPGMRLDRVPFFSFSMLVTGGVAMLTLPAVIAHVVVLQISRADAGALTEAFGPRLGWFVTQPSVYLSTIAVLGIAADVVPVMTAQRTRYRGLVQGSIGLGGLLALGTWAQVPASRDTAVWVVFAVAAAVPALGLLGTLSDSIRGGRPALASPLAFAALSLVLVLLAAVAGLLGAVDTAGSDPLVGFGATLPLGQLYLVVGAALCGAIGACFYWGTKIWGGALLDGAGKALAPLTWVGALLAGGAHVALAIVSAARAADDPPAPDVFAGIAAAGLGLIALSALAALVAALGAWFRRGGDAFADPWGGHTLEWATSSPPPTGNFADPLPAIESGEPLLDARASASTEGGAA